MEIDDFQVGRHVKLTAPGLAIHHLGTFPADATGVVTEAHPCTPKGEYIATVRMDEHFPALDEWDNQFSVYRDADACSEVTERSFELAVGFA